MLPGAPTGAKVVIDVLRWWAKLPSKAVYKMRSGVDDPPDRIRHHDDNISMISYLASLATPTGVNIHSATTRLTNGDVLTETNTTVSSSTMSIQPSERPTVDTTLSSGTLTLPMTIGNLDE